MRDSQRGTRSWVKRVCFQLLSRKVRNVEIATARGGWQEAAMVVGCGRNRIIASARKGKSLGVSSTEEASPGGPAQQGSKLTPAAQELIVIIIMMMMMALLLTTGFVGRSL
jgi:hypothetical protein